MTTGGKMGSDLAAYWFALVLVFVLLGFYGRQAIEWVLMKLYEFFIRENML